MTASTANSKFDPVRFVRKSVAPTGRWLTARRTWMSLRLVRCVLFGFSCIAIVALLWWFRSPDAMAIHSIPGRGVDQTLYIDAGVDVARWILLDYLLMLSIALALVTALLLPWLHVRPMLRWRSAYSTEASAGRRWTLVGVVAAAAYLVADIVETSILWHVANGAAAGGTTWPTWYARMSNAHDLKWISLAVAVIAVAARWSRRTPPLPGDTHRSSTSDAHTTGLMQSKGGISVAPTELPGTESSVDWNAANHTPTGQIVFTPDEGASHLGFIPEEPASPIDATTEGEETTTDDWRPSKDRFGIAVSGGGIRSASFALGVFAVLRERKLLSQARYVTAVSGGCYAASALQHANRMGEDSTVHLVPRLRRRLNYLLPDTRASLSGIVRVLLGLLLNILILYLVIFMVACPIGWAIGSPQIQEGLRYEGPVVTDVITDEHDPDALGRDASGERWSAKPADAAGGGCGLEASPDEPPTIGQVETSPVTSGDRVVSLIEFGVVANEQCVVVDDGDVDDRAWTFDVVNSTTGLIRIADGVAEIIRQPEFEAGNPASATRHGHATIDIAQLVDVSAPPIELTEFAQAANESVSLEVLLEPIPAVRSVPSSIVDLRGDLDWDRRHLLVPGFFGVVMVLLWLVSGLNAVIANPKWLCRTSQLGRVVGSGFGLALAMFVVLPWLVKVVPDRVSEGLVLEPVSGLLAWPVLAVATVTRFVQQLRSVANKQDTTDPSKKRNASAFISKIIGVVTRLAVGVVLAALVVGTSIMMMTGAAINGPFGDNVWISREIFGLRIPRPVDLVVWTGIIVVALAVRTAFAAGTWSLGPYYRRQLRWAFMRDAAGYDAFDGTGPGVDAETSTSATERSRAGYLDGTSAELVVCCAANVLGPDRAPSGRRAVSFSASRRWIGGPELGWVKTTDYLQKMSAARKTDVTVSAMTALSGAAASPAMGKQSLGPLGSVLALLNVRLGGWLPHPAAVLNMTRSAEDDKEESEEENQESDRLTTWKHTPGWPYFVREVMRRHKQEAAYVYVSDGGHWENLGLVESIRRGCNTIIVISAAGDGGYSHATLGEAIEIARTDLDVDIEIDAAWTMRPLAGGEPDQTLASGRQFLHHRGDEPEIGRVAPRGWTFGSFRRRGVPHPHATGQILLIEATMVDELALDVQAYAEAHAEFPDINTGDQFFANRDFEAYRMLGITLAQDALDDAPAGAPMVARILAMPSPAQLPVP